MPMMATASVGTAFLLKASLLRDFGLPATSILGRPDRRDVL
jgi:hypothetical protein